MMVTRYLSMHELSRHVIHETETLEVTARTVASIAQHHRQCTHGNGLTQIESSCTSDLEFYQRFLGNLQLRAAAFDKRLQNEITLVN